MLSKPFAEHLNPICVSQYTKSKPPTQFFGQFSTFVDFEIWIILCLKIWTFCPTVFLSLCRCTKAIVMCVVFTESEYVTAKIFRSFNGGRTMVAPSFLLNYFSIGVRFIGIIQENKMSMSNLRNYYLFNTCILY